MLEHRNALRKSPLLLRETPLRRPPSYCRDLTAVARLVLMVTLGSASLAGNANAEILGYGRLFTNDFLGDGHDRWRSGSYAISQLRGPPGTSSLPTAAGELIEVRLRSEIVAPRRLDGSGPFDRPYAGMLSLGVHTHFKSGPVEYTIGVDLVAVGENTGVSAFQRFVHEEFLGERLQGFAPELGDALYPAFIGEMGMPMEIGEGNSLRPFVEVEAGLETFVRTGVDLSIAANCPSEIRIRDVATGFRYRAAGACADGWDVSGVMGADVARVFDSQLLPAGTGPHPTKYRSRARLGIHVETPTVSVFYGLAWLGKEFEGQSGDQVTGALNVNVRF
jgi:Uncharacterized protein conserved in bacteria (DUF2219)